MTDSKITKRLAQDQETLRDLAAAYLDMWEEIASEHALRGPPSSSRTGGPLPEHDENG